LAQSAAGRQGKTAGAPDRYLARSSIYPLGTKEISQLKALAPPSRYSDDYRHYLTIYTQQAELLLAKARAYQLGSYKLPGVDTESLEAELEKELKRLAGRMGIPTCEKEVGASSSAPSQSA
jgi:hypothetical protein